jgi:hypothetical protein
MYRHHDGRLGPTAGFATVRPPYFRQPTSASLDTERLS